MKNVKIYTDGGCKGNPGPGGYGVILVSGKHHKELSAGYRMTTNNRMELRAAIAGLEVLREPCEITIFSDSKYLVEANTKNWIQGWQRKNWINSKKEPVKNRDLWERLIAAMEPHKIEWQWVKGHAGHIENERCDELANEAIASGKLLVDEGFAG